MPIPNFPFLSFPFRESLTTAAKFCFSTKKEKKGGKSATVNRDDENGQGKIHRMKTHRMKIHHMKTHRMKTHQMKIH
jgi:hypothetical protein